MRASRAHPDLVLFEKVVVVGNDELVLAVLHDVNFFDDVLEIVLFHNLRDRHIVEKFVFFFSLLIRGAAAHEPSAF